MALSGGEIALIIFVILVILVGLGFLIYFLFRSNDKKELEATDANFTVESPTTIKATWSATGNAKDELTLYASTEAITIDKKTGIPVPNKDGTVINSSATVGSAALSVSVSNLLPDTLYYLALVVTNPSIKDDSNTITNKLRTTTNVPDSQITINKQGVDVSRISYNTSPDIATVTYKPKPIASDGTIFVKDGAFICAAEDDSQTSCDPTSDRFMYNDNGMLRIDIPQNPNPAIPDIPVAAYSWVYNFNKKNEWCLASDTTTKCMWGGDGTANFMMEVGSSEKATKWDNKTVSS